MITADAGGSNSYRNRSFKVELAPLAAETGVEITVCHYPPSTSKWNKVVLYTGFPGVYEVTNEPAPRSYNRRLWMPGRLKGATYPPDC